MGTDIVNPVTVTWEWDGTDWHLKDSVSSGLSGLALAYDAFHGGVVGLRAFGGTSQTSVWNGQSWHPSPATIGVAATQCATDESRQRVVVFGGLVGGFSSGRTCEYGYAPRPASVTPFGTGCGMPPLALAADANTSPRIGTTLRTDVANVPFGFPFVAIGSNEQFLGPFPLPLVLDGFGYLGCLLHHDAIVSVPCTQWSGPSTATFDLSIPNVPALLTARIYLQAWSLAPAANPGGLVLSNALRVVIGNS